MSIAEAVTVDEIPPGVRLIDVREPDEWAAAHVQGAQLVPLAQVPDHVQEFSAAAPVYLICRSGNRSGRAAQWLRQQGVAAVNVAGGMQAWAARGRPMVSDSGVEPRVI